MSSATELPRTLDRRSSQNSLQTKFVDKALGPGPMRPADTTTGGLTSYGYYEEVRIKPTSAYLSHERS